MPRKDYRVLIQAEEVILNPEATADQVRQAVAAVDALKDPQQSAAIRRTLQHEAHHRQAGPQGAVQASEGSPEGAGH